MLEGIKKFHISLLLSAVFTTQATFENQIVREVTPEGKEIHYLTPPQLSSNYLGRRVKCKRPMREERPELGVKQWGAQYIGNNYGHGGSGWTLGPGSAQYVNDLLLEHVPHKKTPITIIGAGVIGLFSAYDLVNKGYTNLKIIAAKREKLTSHNAGGLLAPVSMSNAPEIQDLIDKIGIEAYKFYERIAHRQDPVFTEGAIIVPTYFKTRDESGLEPYVGKVMQPAKDVIVDFGNGTRHDMVCYKDGIYMDTRTLMNLLNDFLEKRQIPFIQHKVKDFSEIDTPFALNCTGLGAKELCKDKKMVPVLGHLIMLENQRVELLKYMILVYLGEHTTEDGKTVKESVYYFPKEVGVLGGTFIKGATRKDFTEQEFENILRNALKFFGVSEDKVDQEVIYLLSSGGASC